MNSTKDEALKVIQGLSEHATWEDIMYELYVKMKIYSGLEDITNGKVISQENAMKKLLEH
ncbi:MAG: hypothetical protein VR69_00630 [Peptococcaceae bacterium BRH_c4b]|nr:MAG: hypothetical protein VR69_00630 [Peptococcaceae bacterium BRH_c4b]